MSHHYRLLSAGAFIALIFGAVGSPTLRLDAADPGQDGFAAVQPLLAKYCFKCHGAQAKEGHFDMPNPDLPKLNFADMSKFKKEDIEWMKNEVMPTMGKILQLPLHSEENPKGFGCLHCHTQATGQ